MLRHQEMQRQQQLPRRQWWPQQLPAAHPPLHRYIRPGLHDLCRNCALPGHISCDCTNNVRCIACGEVGHMSRGCKRPRSPSGSPWSPSPEAPGAHAAAGEGPLGQVLPPPPPGPPPPGAVRLERSWSRVVWEGSEESSARGLSFSVPFGQSRAQAAAALRQAQPPAAPPVRPCFLEYSDEMHHMEEQLPLAVVVTVTGTRPEVDLADVAALLHAEFGVGPNDMPIRAYSPEDFLLLCSDRRLRDRMVAKGLTHASWFSLSLRGWLRQSHATAVDLPFFVPLKLMGVPGHAWNRRMTDALMEGFGFVIDVAAPTTRMDDMSVFKIWVRALDPENLPASRLLFVEEPRPAARPDGRHRGAPVRRRAKTLRYEVCIRRAVEAVVAEMSDPLPPPPPPLRRSPSPPPSCEFMICGGCGFSVPGEVPDSSEGDGGSTRRGGGASDSGESLAEAPAASAEGQLAGDGRGPDTSADSVRIPNVGGALDQVHGSQSGATTGHHSATSQAESGVGAGGGGGQAKVPMGARQAASSRASVQLNDGAHEPCSGYTIEGKGSPPSVQCPLRLDMDVDSVVGAGRGGFPGDLGASDRVSGQGAF
ncbi:hypothetical protein QYE76_046875 [Lolium multiflorum]|uniref:CCHC-type domain-containing protein n=1 Tax=Lolium multiflorum TaxID=4521 RepID=A0AAD8WYR9_LOLMU|nr:hypothetical protein QYE76_046875 [Lolium multiflorum]